MDGELESKWKKAKNAKKAVDALIARIGELYLVSERSKSIVKKSKFDLDRDIDASVIAGEVTDEAASRIGRLAIAVEANKRIDAQSNMEMISTRSLLEGIEMEFDKHVSRIISMSNVKDGPYTLDFENRKVVPNG